MEFPASLYISLFVGEATASDEKLRGVNTLVNTYDVWAYQGEASAGDVDLVYYGKTLGASGTGSGTSTFTITTSGVGAKDFTGVGTANVTFSPSGVGAADKPTSGLSTVTINVTGVGSRDFTGTGIANVSFSATGVGASDRAGSGLTTSTFSASGVKAGSTTGTADVSAASAQCSGSGTITGLPTPMQPIGPIDWDQRKKKKPVVKKPKLVYKGAVAAKAKPAKVEVEGETWLGIEYARLEDEELMGVVLELFYA